MRIIVFIQSLLIVGLTVFCIYSYTEHKKTFGRFVLQSNVNHCAFDVSKGLQEQIKELQMKLKELRGSGI